MRLCFIIAWNSFRELLRQPAYLVVLTGAVALILLLANVSYFGFGEEARLVKTTSLSILLLAGLLNAVLGAAAAVAQEVRSGTALTLLAKPVGRTRFLLAKYGGIALALLVQVHVTLMATLLAGRMAFEAHESPDWWAIGAGVTAIMAAFVVGGLSNYFTQRSFHSDTAVALAGLFTVGFLVVGFVDRTGAVQSFGAGLDWRLVPAGVLGLLALWILAALALACAARMTLLPTLVVCSGFFLVGLLSEQLLGTAARNGSWLAAVGYTVLPNWQVFWLADVFGGAGSIPIAYVAKAALYCGVYLVLTLTVALLLFEDRDLT